MKSMGHLQASLLYAFFGVLLFQTVAEIVGQPKNNEKNGKGKAEVVVIAWVDGVPAVTEVDVEKYKQQMISENPQLEEYIKMISPDEINRSIGELLLQQFLVDRYIEKSKISQKADYKEDVKIAQQMATTTVNNKYFTQEIATNIAPTDKELRMFYETHKTTVPGIQKERGGVKAVGVSFGSEAEAKAFLATVNSGDLVQIAEKQNLEMRDFGLVSQSSMNVDENIRGAALSITKFPQTITVTDMDGTPWVIQAVSKKDDVFYPFEEVKDLVSDRALQYQIAEKISEKLNILKKEYKVTVNEDFFGGIEPLTVSEEDVESLIEEMEEEGL